MSFTHFLELRDAERLYVGTRDLADATRGKLVVIEASRVLYARIFVYRVQLQIVRLISNTHFW